eukprot:GFKZ01008041.1.p1 GENE.GFKZ01008041.1~~GFKZ01008041.1.p1  ORF type:complete len:556 (-),score=82.90 GFKZ01008041.1:2134-3801(-)
MSERQVIDANGIFHPPFPIHASNLDNLHYTVISVVGCQSGGKSTLLNAAFGTSFPVLDAPRSGRRRTTLGVWAAPAVPNLLILDVEGADSRERGEGAVAFQTRTALFALALSDVLLVNMWAHDVGRYSAANYDLFETVFAHATGLRKGRNRALLVVVVRDVEQDAPVVEIGRVLAIDLRRIWIRAGRSEREFEQLFELRVVPLPHKVYNPGRFEAEASKLGQGVRALTVRQMVPIGGFETFSHGVWAHICKQTGGDGDDAEFSLDLPRHVLLTAYYKAGEVVKAILEHGVGRKLDELRAEIEMSWNRPVPEFGARVEVIVRESLEEFAKGTQMYKNASESVEKRRVELGVALVETCGELRERYLSVCREYCRRGFEDEFRPMLGGTDGYERTAKRLANSYVARYKALVDSGRLPLTLNRFVQYKEVEIECRVSDEQEKRQGEQVQIETLDTPETIWGDFGLNETTANGDVDEYSVGALKTELLNLVEERKRMGEIMLPGGINFASALPKPEPWWKGLLIRTAILFINYLQATQGQRAAIKKQKKHERDFPPEPTF